MQYVGCVGVFDATVTCDVVVTGTPKASSAVQSVKLAVVCVPLLIYWSMMVS